MDITFFNYYLNMKCVLLTVVFIFNLCSAYRILLVFPYPSRSHSILGEGFVNSLTKAGHDVIYITSYLMKNPPRNLRQIEVASNREYNDKIMEEYTEAFINNKLDVKALTLMFEFFPVISNGTISNPDVQKIMQDPKEKFDAIVVEWMFSELYAGFAAVFDCPFIWSSSVEPHALVLSLIDEMPNSAYTPNTMFSIEPAPLKFGERLKEAAILVFSILFRAYNIYTEEKVYKSVFGPAVEKRGRTLPSYENIVYNASLMLGNSDISYGIPVRLPQNYKAIGGYHIPNSLPPLSEDLQNILDNAKYGVIYFSLGTIVKSKHLPTEMREGILETFRGLKQTVIWKFEGELIDIPTNVKIINWAPQQSILAHQNCVLFITHGGLLSITESIHYGVPIIGIPLFSDQFTNIKRAVNKGFGKEVNLDHGMSNNLKMAIEDILGNPRYSERVLELSLVYHDRPMTPGEELVHWVEHVVKTRGALHLRSPALMVPWYQKMSLDVLLFIITIMYISCICLKYLCSFRKSNVSFLKKNK